MIDNLRDSVTSGPMFQEEGPTPSENNEKPKGDGRILGMSAIQRLIIALMLFMLTCVLGSLCLVLTQKVILPF
jgi:hypothetical protein